MKTIFKLLPAMLAALLVISAAIFNACSKQETESPAKVESPQKDYTIYNKLASFRSQMEFYKNNPSLKSNESVEVDSAIWLLEGAMNLSYGFPYKEYTDYEKGTAIINLEKNNEGKINYDELAVKYQQVIEEAREDYYNSGFEEKGLYLVNLEITEETETDVTFMVETITGSLGEDNPSSPIFDSWMYGEYLGGCGSNPSTDLTDAAHKLAEAYPTYDMTEDKGIIEPVVVTLKGGDEWLKRPGDILDNEYDYYTFSVSDEIEPVVFDVDCCLESAKMGQYYNDLEYVVQVLAPAEFELPGTFELLDFIVNEGVPVDIGQDEMYQYRHVFIYVTGIPFERPNDPPSPL